MSVFERFLSLWVFLCIVVGIGVTLLGNWLVTPPLPAEQLDSYSPG